MGRVQQSVVPTVSFTGLGQWVGQDAQPTAPVVVAQSKLKNSRAANADKRGKNLRGY